MAENVPKKNELAQSGELFDFREKMEYYADKQEGTKTVPKILFMYFEKRIIHILSLKKNIYYYINYLIYYPSIYGQAPTWPPHFSIKSICEITRTGFAEN